MSGVQFNINVNSNATTVLNQVETGVRNVTRGFGDAVNKLLAFNQGLEGIRNLQRALNDAIQPGIALNTSLTDLSAITGQTGEGLKAIEKAARDSAKVFGTDAAMNVESYKLILSQLNPEIANSSEAMKAMGDNVNILSKTMGGDTVAATNVLTTAMNQYGVSTDDPIAASKVMAEMMNVMAAAAKEGSAELPQIQAALSQTGMVAKSVGVTFSETNAAIQVLDKAGKKGAEGGVALRNVLSTLSEGRFLPKEVRAELAAVGINVEQLGNKSLPLTQRLNMLKPLMNDTALMTKLFGKENGAAALALVQGSDAVEEYNTKIQGTNTAVEQANIVMGSYAERVNRIKARMDDLKISIFNVTQSFMPYVNSTVSSLVVVGQLASGVNSLATFTRALRTAQTEQTVASIASSGSTGILTRLMGGLRTALFTTTIATRALSTAIYSIPVIGWIALAITAIVAAVMALWESSRKFREILFGIWEVGKAVFHNIGVVIGRVWDMVIKPVFNFIWAIVKKVFHDIKSVVGFVIETVVGHIQWLWGIAVSVWTAIADAAVAAWNWIWEIVQAVGTAIAEFFGGVWKVVSDLFSGIASFVNEWLIEPIKNAFNFLWDFIKGVFDKIMEGLRIIFKPIIDIINKIFDKEGMKEMGEAWEEGKAKGAASYDGDHEGKANEGGVSNVQTTIEEKKMGSLLKGMGGNAAGGALGKGSGSGGGNAKPTTINLTIQKLIGIGEMRLSNLKEGAREAGQSVAEQILISLQSVNAQ